MNITLQDKHRVVEIIEQSMCHLPGVKWVIGEDQFRSARRMHHLAEFIFESAYLRKGIHLSSDRSGVAILYRNSQKISGWDEFRLRLKFIFLCCGLRRVMEMKEREAYVRKQRQSIEDFLYFWVFSVHPDSRRLGAAASELKNVMLRMSRETGLPILLETSHPQNRKVYERYGFRVYHEWFISRRSFTLWFMLRSPDPA